MLALFVGFATVDEYVADLVREDLFFYEHKDATVTLRPDVGISQPLHAPCSF